MLALSFGLSACGDDYPGAGGGDYVAQMTGIRIVNGGFAGDSIVEGTINQDTKLVSFPRLNPKSKNFNAVIVEGTFNDGSSLVGNSFDFSGMTEDEPKKEKLIKVVNQTKYMYYNMKLRLNVPVFGAYFEKPLGIYNYSGKDSSGNSAYSYTGGTTRGTAFDGEYVLIVNRSAPHLLRVSDIEAGNVSNPIFLDMTGVSGGTFALNMGGLANGHVYLANLSGGLTSPLKIYYYETPTSKPKLLGGNDTGINTGNIPGVGLRNGDNFSLNLDENGNGYIFFGDNASTKILRLTVTNHTEIDVNKAEVLANQANTRGFVSLIQIPGTDQYLYSGVGVNLALADDRASVGYQLAAGDVAAEGMESRMFWFNKKRYLLMTTAGYGGASKIVPSIYAYNMTKGDSPLEALQNFAASTNKVPELTFSLGGVGNGNPAAQTGYSIVKDTSGNDSVLYVFGARTESGWALMKFPIASQED